jgi:O-methyltransferase domain/Dimerisation domain
MDEKPQAPPAIMLRQLAYVMRASRALYAAAELGIADILAAGPMTSEEIGAKAGADGPTVRRLMRALVAQGVFEEPESSCFRLNAAGELLRRDVPDSQRAGVLFAAGKMRWDLWSDFLECVRTGQAAVERAFGKTIFERNAENPEESALFSEAMASYSAALSAPLMAAYDFGSLRRLADIGGGTGRLIADILAAHPSMRGILFDLPYVVERAPALLQASGVEARCEVVGGSFFEGVPPGADAYLLRAILHDWDDERSIAILKSIRNATVGGAVLLIVERVLPGKAEMGKAVDSYLLDLEMLVNTPGGRERSESEFREILNAAGFGPLRLIPTSTATSILKARPA